MSTAALQQQPYLLFDSSALSPLERERLRGSVGVHWVYDDLGEEAAVMGPVWTPDGEAASALAATLRADEARDWAVARIASAASIEVLDRHLRATRYVYAHDGQRFFFRYADTRSLSATWSVLTSTQRDALLGPAASWRFVDREGVAIELNPSSRRQPFVSLRLSAAQMAALLDAALPDQLLASVLEQSPELAQIGTARQRFAWAKTLCAQLRSAGVERYPTQLAAIEAVLRTQGAALQRADLIDKLVHAERDVAFDLLGALTADATHGRAPSFAE